METQVMTKSTQSDNSPAIQGEGDYEAARRYRERLTEFARNADVEGLAKSASVVSAKDAREYALAEESARSRSKGDDPADIGIMYSKQTPGANQAVAEKAYELWQARGRPMGSAEQDWYEAQRLLSDAAGSAAASADEAGIESFPASDPPSTHSGDEPPSNAGDKWKNHANPARDRSGT
jgi:Protein of unknown function (DUF2934)